MELPRALNAGSELVSILWFVDGLFPYGVGINTLILGSDLVSISIRLFPNLNLHICGLILGSELVSIFIFEIQVFFVTWTRQWGGVFKPMQVAIISHCAITLSFMNKLLSRACKWRSFHTVLQLWVLWISYCPVGSSKFGTRQDLQMDFGPSAKKVWLKCFNRQATNQRFFKLSCLGWCQASQC